MKTNLDWMADPDFRETNFTDQHVSVNLSREGLARCAADNALLRATKPAEKRSNKVAAAGLLMVIVSALAWGVVQVWQEGGLS